MALKVVRLFILMPHYLPYLPYFILSTNTIPNHLTNK